MIKDVILLQRLLDQLNSRDPIVLAEALREARALPPDDLLRLVMLGKELQRARRKQGTHIFAGVYAILIVPLFYHAHKEEAGTRAV